MNGRRRGFRFALLAAASLAVVGDAPALRAELSSDGAPPASTQPVSQPIRREKKDGPVRLRVELDRDRTDLSTAVRLTMTVEAERGVKIAVPEVKGVLGDFVVKQSSELQRTEVADGVRAVQEHVLEPVTPGTAVTGPISIEYEDARERLDGSTGTSRGTVTIDPIAVIVEGQLADAKGPVTLAWAGLSPIWWWIIGVTLGTLAVALAARRLARRRPGQAPIPALEEPLVPAHIWALGELDRLIAERLVARGQVQEFYYRVNALLREYIERRFGMMAGEQTSEEFIRSLRDSHQLQSVHKTVLQQFVDACDPVKYARQVPGEADVLWVESTARQVIVETADIGGNGELVHGAAATLTADSPPPARRSRS